MATFLTAEQIPSPVTVQEVYDQYRIPPNLQDHMIAVAAVGKLIVENLNSAVIAEATVLQTLLFHDLGNIIKYDFSRPELFTECDTVDCLEELQQLQHTFQERYGTNPELATAIILRELSLAADAIVLLEQLDMRRLQQVLETGSLEEKIVLYCDQRVTPYGIVSLEERIEDVLVRYPHLRDKIQAGRDGCYDLEEQLAGYMNLHPRDITHTEAAASFAELRQYNFR